MNDPNFVKNHFRDVLNYPMRTITVLERDNVFVNFSRAMGVPIDTLNQWSLEMWPATNGIPHQYQTYRTAMPPPPVPQAPTQQILTEQEWIERVVPRLNSSEFDKSSEAYKIQFLMAALKAGQFDPDNLDDFNMRVQKILEPKCSRPDHWQTLSHRATL